MLSELFKNEKKGSVEAQDKKVMILKGQGKAECEIKVNFRHNCLTRKMNGVIYNPVVSLSLR